MITLVPIDSSWSSLEAVKYAARSQANGDFLLLYVAPSGRPADLEAGRFLLENCRRACEETAGEARVKTRLEVGNPRAKVPEVASHEQCDRVVMAAYGVNALPHVDRVNPEGAELSAELQCPVILVLPTGQGIPAAAAARRVQGSS